MSETEPLPLAPLRERVAPPAVVAEPRHPDVAVWRAAPVADVDALVELFAASDAVDHPRWSTPREDIEEVFESVHRNPATDSMIGLDADGRIVAAGDALLHPSQDDHIHAYIEGRVHPELRGRGIGRELMRWEHERALQLVAAIDGALPAAIYIYAEEGNSAARHLAERRGLAEERWFTSMERRLDDEIPEVTASVDAAAVAVVPYEPALKEATRLARNDAFRDHWGSLPTPVERWDRFVEGPRLRADLSRVAVEGDRVVAFALGSVNEDDWPLQGYSSVYIDLIGVTRDHRRQHLAPTVITALLRAARDAGLERAVLDVDTESPTGANSLYGGLGFTPTERMVCLVAHL